MRNSFIMVMVLLLAASLLHAGTTGKLVGKVKDTSGNPVPAAQVFFPELETGAMTNAKGEFIIINIPPGTYTVVCQRQSYQGQQVNNVGIEVDYTTVQNFELAKASIEIEGLKVTDRAEELVKKEGGSDMTITAESIEELPVDDINEIAALQAGVSIANGELHVRGGRANEVQYTVDGMSVSDPVDGGRALTIDSDAIANMKTMIGGITAEYGNAQSGVINIVTKSGGEVYSGKIEVASDHIFDEGNNLDEVKFAIGGPVLGKFNPDMAKRFTFFLNGAAQWQDGSARYYRITDPMNDFNIEGNQQLLDIYFPAYNPYEDRDNVLNFDLGDRNYNTYNYNLKTKYEFSNTTNLTLAVRGDISRQEPFSWAWRYALEHYQEVETKQQQYIATFDHTFNPQMNWKIKLSYYNKTIVSGPKGIDREDYFVLADDPYSDTVYDPSTLTPDSTPEQWKLGYYWLDGTINDLWANNWQYLPTNSYDAIGITGFVSPGTIYDEYWDDETSNYQFRTDFEYALNTVHGFKTGLEVISHHLVKDRIVDPWSIRDTDFHAYLKKYFDSDTYDFANFDGTITTEVDPTDTTVVTAYVYWDPNSAVDKVYQYVSPEGEVENTVVYYKPTVYQQAAFACSGESDGYEADPWQYAFYLQDTMEWEGLILNLGMRFDAWYLGDSYDKRNVDGTIQKIEFDSSDQLQIMVSPRIGVSHPISERDVIHFAYNYQNQLPQFQYIFTSYRKEDAALSNQTIVVGNPSLEPQTTITYEVGLQHQMGEDYVLDVTAYYKNIYNYVSTEKLSYENSDYYQYISEDYGSSRGININLQKMLSNYISGSVSYTLAWANGNNSEAQVQDEATSLREYPLDWDVRHDFSLNVRFTVQRDEDFYVPFTDFSLPLGARGDFNASFILHMASGEPYTPQTVSGTQQDINSERMDYTHNVDMNFSKRIYFNDKTNVKIYFLIDNLFNHRNITDVYAKTGSATDPGASPGDDDNSSEQNYVEDLYYNNPLNYSASRTFTLGMAFNF